VYDAAGRTVELPEQVESVTATGLAAQLVSLFGGSGALAGCDADFLAASLTASVFPDASAAPWWYGAGDKGIGEEAFAALLDAAPQVCFEWSGVYCFSAAQQQSLEEAGIARVVLPAITGKDALLTASAILGQVLGGDAETAAGDYSAWVEGVFRDVSEACAGVEKSALFLAGWDADASYSLSNAAFEARTGSGLAYACSPKKPQLVSACMAAAGFTNESTRIRAMHRDSDYVYVTPMFHQFDPVVSGSRASFYSGAGEFGAAYDLFVARQVTQSLYYQLGSTDFPALLAADEATAAAVENDFFWQYRESDANGFVSIDGESYYRGIGGPYRGLVQPEASRRWTEASLDAPLEAYWLACVLTGAMDMDTVRERTADFYSRFLGMTLTEEALDELLGEE